LQSENITKDHITSVMSKKNALNYICPFIDEDCIHIDSLSMSKSVICDHCEIYIWEKNEDNMINFPEWGIQIPVLTLYN